ncbi:hypothetical protein [Chroococcidiopsis sp. CCMEE 29]|nr:hypothetical protein [Chroococcidiopsis sp. CCMEE 29]
MLETIQSQEVEVEIRWVEEEALEGVAESELDVPMLDCMRLKAMSNFL